MVRSQRLRADLERARQNALQWQARAKDIEKRIMEAENQEIVQAVREGDRGCPGGTGTGACFDPGDERAANRI